MRMFVAVRPPEDAVEHLDAFLDVRRDAGPFRWTDAEQFHLTLAFLGHVPEYAVDELDERLTAAAAKRHGFVARLAGGGAFPDAAKAKVLWVGVDVEGPSSNPASAEQTSARNEPHELERLSRGAKAAASTSGIEVDGARFRPHVTVARIGAPREVSNWVRLLDAYQGPRFEVAEIELVASHLGEGRRGRPRHEVVASYRLGERPKG